MQSFIQKVVNQVLENKIPFSKQYIILPSQRAGVFLKNEFIAKLNKPNFLPTIISIEDFIQEIADIQLVDSIQLLFEFYKVYTQIVPKSELEPFAQVSQWANILINDFNEADSYLVNSQQLFANLKDIKRLENWFLNEKPTKLAKQYLHFFSYVDNIYEVFYNNLLQQKIGYSGLIYRETIKNLEFFIQHKKDFHFIFAGFNALNFAEEKLFQELLQANIASVYWDVDESFLKKNHLAGQFLRNYKNNWPYYKTHSFQWQEKNKSNDKSIEIIAAPKNVAQLKLAGQLLASQPNLEKTALVLADENLLNIALNSLPENVNTVNITMGYPLKYLPISNFFIEIFKLHLNKLKSENIQQNTYYYKDILKVISNSFLAKKYGKVLTKLKSNLLADNEIFIHINELISNFSESELKSIEPIISIFNPVNNLTDFIKMISNLIQELKENTSSLNKEYLYRFFLIFQQILQLNEKHHYIKDLTTYFQFFKQILSSEKLFFKGEPLSGLQIMGMLETRMLDFDNVILTSMNEGIIPKGKQDNSFIPLDIKKYFNLPTYQEKDAVFAYHFNRLLLRTKNCFLIYNSETDGYGAGEKSRFLTQLLLNNPYIKHKVVIPEMEVVTNKPITISKNREILQKIEAYFKKGVSPSAIANYLNNPIQFYEEKILGVYKEQEFEETIALNTFGTVIHETLNELYQPIVGKILSLSEIDFMLNNYESVLKKQYKLIFKKGNVTVGKNRLFYEISKKYISLFLKHEKDNLSKGNQIKILAIEKPLEAKLNINNLDFPVKLIGTADRIDLFNQTLRIVDYKTGKVEASHLRISDFEAVKSDSKFSKAMQVMFYAYLYQQKNKKNVNEIESGIISFKNLKAGFIKTNFAPGRQKDFQITNERLNNFEEVIQAILEEIINVKKPFIENLEAKY